MRGPRLRRLERFPVFNGGYVPILEDPYHRDGRVGILTWIAREIDELLYGEV